jgi:hypothetical protein
MTARAFAGLLTAGEVQELKLGELTCSFTLATSTQWYQHPSRQDYGAIEVPWPSCSLTLSIGDSQNNASGGYMVGTAGPSFPTFARAYAAFFSDQWTQTGMNQGTLWTDGTLWHECGTSHLEEITDPPVRALYLDFYQHPQRDSNPCRRLERAVS